MKDYDNEISYYQKAIKLNPKSPNHTRSGKNLQVKGNLDNAIQLTKRQLNSIHSLPELLQFGNDYQDKGNLDKAIPLYQKAIEFNPQYSGAYSDMGTIYERKAIG